MKLRKTNNILALILLSIGITLVFTGCSKYKNTTTEEVNVKAYVDSVEQLMNLRYYGLDTKTVDEALISEEYKDSIKDRLKTPENITDRGVFISLEDEFEQREVEDYVLSGDVGTSDIISIDTEGTITDGRIEEYNGKRGIFTNDVQIDSEGQFRTMIYDDSVWVTVPREVQNCYLIGNPEYKFKVVDYTYFDGGNLIVTLKSDIDEAFNEICNNIEIVETTKGLTDDEVIKDGILTWKDKDKKIKMTQEEYDAHMESFYNEYRTIKVILDMKLDVAKGEITDVNLDSITGTLMYE